MTRRRSGPVRFRKPRPLTPAESKASAGWEPPYQYECAHGHVVLADRAVASCPAYVRGERCTGDLRRFGRGSGRGSNLRQTA